jgi:type VI secretion system secreted protein Hcp
VAAADIFVSFKGPDVKGESLDQNHPDTIECLSFDWGVVNAGTSGTGGGAGSGAAVKHDFSISKYVDRSSNVLMQACAAGTHFKTATVWIRKSGGDKPMEYMQIELTENVVISGYNISGTGRDNVVPIEHIQVNFTALMMTYNEQGPTGGGKGPSQLGYNFGKTAKM